MTGFESGKDGRHPIHSRASDLFKPGMTVIPWARSAFERWKLGLAVRLASSTVPPIRMPPAIGARTTWRPGMLTGRVNGTPGAGNEVL